MPDVIRCEDALAQPLPALLGRYGIKLRLHTATEQPIPGSFWGDDEAGLIANELFIRPQTPLHSALHEACHFVCMDSSRRTALNTDAGGDFDEENAVCYLQILLAEYFPGIGRLRMQTDMDRWGYSFRLGSANAWFERDAEDAKAWLLAHKIIDNQAQPTWRVRA